MDKSCRRKKSKTMKVGFMWHWLKSWVGNSQVSQEFLLLSAIFKHHFASSSQGILLFSPNLILWLAIMTTALHYCNSVSFYKVTSKYFYPEVNLNFPYIVHSHRLHKTGEKTHIYVCKHAHTCTHSHSFSGSSCLDFLMIALKRALIRLTDIASP